MLEISDFGSNKLVILIPLLASFENKPGSGFLVLLTMSLLLEHADKKIRYKWIKIF